MMKHIFQLSYWELNNHWHVNDIHNLAGRSAKWYTPMRILNLSIDEYIQLLLTFNAKRLSYYEPTDYLGFSFDKEIDAKKFCVYVNKIAKQKNFYCE